MKISNRVLTRGAAVVAVSALVTVAAVPAFADPVRPYSTGGSDTIQDVWNGLTNDSTAIAPSIASWNATAGGTASGVITSTVNGSTVYTNYNTIQTKTGGNWFPRPNGSGAGRKAVCASWDTAGDPTHDLQLNGTGSDANLVNGDIDFSRSSSGPSSSDHGTASFLDFLPFARDAVSIGYNTATAGTDTAGGLPAGLNLTTAEITALYTGVPSADGVVTFTNASGTPENPATSDATAKVYINGVSGNTNGLTVGSSYEVYPYLPQAASGTRQFFAGAVGISNNQGANAAYVSDLPGSVFGSGTGVGATGPWEENNGRALTVPGAIGPFSAAQWISQQQGAAPNTIVANEAIGSVNGLVAVTGSGSSAAQGPLFGSTDLSGNYNTPPTSGVGNFNRDVYDVIPAMYTGGSATAKQSALVSILTGGGTGQIQSAAAAGIVHKFGFGTLSYATGTGSAIPGNCPSNY